MAIETVDNGKIVLTPAELGEIKETVKNETTFRITTLIALKTLEKRADQTNGALNIHTLELVSNGKDLASNRTAHIFFKWFLGINFTALIMVIALVIKLSLSLK